MNYTAVGGKICPQIIIDFNAVLPISDEQAKQQFESAPADVARVVTTELHETHTRRLAVVGGGPSIATKLEEIKVFSPDVWAIGGAYEICIDHGIDALLFAADPHEIVARWARTAKRALVASRVHPSAIDVLRANKAEIEFFDVEGPNKIFHGTTTATCAPHLGYLRGYRDITFFGCESSYFPEATHAYMREERDKEMIITCNGEDFLTAPDFYIQAKEMQQMFAAQTRGGFHERSGGLLRAMIAAKGEHRISWISQALFDGLKIEKELCEAA